MIVLLVVGFCFCFLGVFFMGGGLVFGGGGCLLGVFWYCTKREQQTGLFFISV